VTPKPPPPQLPPWRKAWFLLTWPWQARQFKHMGAIHTGWMTWELPAPGHLPDPVAPAVARHPAGRRRKNNHD
jgi:hypothetical protein